MTIENVGERIVAAMVALVAIVGLGGATWITITRKRGGFRNYGDDEFEMPCTHPVRDVVVTSAGKGLPEVAIMARCRSCHEDASDGLNVSIESDGRIVVENVTAETVAIAVDGEMHHLEPARKRNPASHIVRARAVDRLRIGDPVRLVDDEELSMPGYGGQQDHDIEFGGDRN